MSNQRKGLRRGFSSERERRLWALAGAWLISIYSSLYFVQFLLNFLRERNLLRVSLFLLFGFVATALLAKVLRRNPGPREKAVATSAAIVYVILLARTSIVQEQIHYLQYGVLAALFYSALLERWGTPGEYVASTSAALAVALTALCGWLDEGIQAILPNRVYDLRDVRLNAFAGALAIAVLASLRVARERDRGAKGESDA